MRRDRLLILPLDCHAWPSHYQKPGSFITNSVVRNLVSGELRDKELLPLPTSSLKAASCFALY
jgi:hypothetical protein